MDLSELIFAPEYDSKSLVILLSLDQSLFIIAITVLLAKALVLIYKFLILMSFKVILILLRKGSKIIIHKNNDKELI